MDILRIIFSFLPLIWLLFSLGKMKMPAHKAGTIALIITCVIAVIMFNMEIVPIIQASIEGIALALLTIIWVIVSALFVYNVTAETGGMEQIKKMLSMISPDRRVQGLILAFSFGGFLEAVAGFGTSVAIPAGILVAMGFEPILAASVCLIANTIPVAFGVLGVPITTLAQVTGLDLGMLSYYTALQLTPFVILLPLVLIFAVTGSVKHLKGVIGVSVASGAAFALGQILTTIFIGPEIAAIAGSLLSLVIIVVWIKLWPVKKVWLFNNEKTEYTEANDKIDRIKGLKAWSPYIIILLIILAIKFIPFLKFLGEYPFKLKKQFYFGAGGRPIEIQTITGAGTILFISAILGGMIQKASLKKLMKIFLKTIRQVTKTAITVLSIVILSKIMVYGGMIDAIASALAAISGSFYPVIAPAIGALGTFFTGSDTSSNIIFGNMQKQTAANLSVSQEWITAANASGATAGKMISPQSISIAAAAVNLPGSEGKLLGMTIKYCIFYVILLGILVYLFTFSV